MESEQEKENYSSDVEERRGETWVGRSVCVVRVRALTLMVISRAVVQKANSAIRYIVY